MDEPRRCPVCEDADLQWGYETVSGHPNDPRGTGTEVFFCPNCGYVDDDSRREVGT